MGQFHWDPDTYLELMHSEVPDYERLQDAVAHACAAPPVPVRAMLELGTGTGETSGRVLLAQPDAELVGIDASRGMLDAARDALPADRVTLSLARLEDALPPGPFQLVFSALAVHHLDGPRKAGAVRARGGGPTGRWPVRARRRDRPGRPRRRRHPDRR